MMKYTLVKLFGSPQSPVVKNYLSLSIVQAANYVLPFVVLPYVTRILGTEGFGVVVYVQYLVTFFGVFTNYGFDLLAARDIAVWRNHHDKANEVFCKYLQARVFFFLIGLAAIVGYSLVIGHNATGLLVFLAAFMFNSGFVLFPAWFYQGVERMVPIAVFNFLVRATFVGSVFAFVTHPSDMDLYLVLYGLGPFIFGMFFLWWTLHRYQLRLFRVGIAEVRRVVREGWPVFLGSSGTLVYTSLNVIILNHFSNSSQVALYGSAVKVSGALQTLTILPIAQTFYPHASRAWVRGTDEAARLLRRVAGMFLSLAVPLVVLVFLFSHEIVTLAFGGGFAESAGILRIVIMTVLLSGVTTLLAQLGLLTGGMQKQYARVSIVVVALDAVLSTTLCLSMASTGVAIAYVAAETLYLLLALWVLRLRLRRGAVETPA